MLIWKLGKEILFYISQFNNFIFQNDLNECNVHFKECLENKSTMCINVTRATKIYIHWAPNKNLTEEISIPNKANGYYLVANHVIRI